MSSESSPVNLTNKSEMPKNLQNQSKIPKDNNGKNLHFSKTSFQTGNEVEKPISHVAETEKQVNKPTRETFSIDNLLLKAATFINNSNQTEVAGGNLDQERHLMSHQQGHHHHHLQHRPKFMQLEDHKGLLGSRSHQLEEKMNLTKNEGVESDDESNEGSSCNGRLFL